MDKRCKNCEHWRITVMDMDSGEKRGRCELPIRKMDYKYDWDWCGEYRPKDTEEAQG